MTKDNLHLILPDPNPNLNTQITKYKDVTKNFFNSISQHKPKATHGLIIGPKKITLTEYKKKILIKQKQKKHTTKQNCCNVF